MVGLMVKRPMAMKKRDKSMGSAGQGDEGLRLDNTQPKKGLKKGNMSPKAYTFSMPRRINMN